MRLPYAVAPRYRHAIVSALLACTGCAVHKPAFQTYRLVKHDTGQVLIPPGVSAPDLAQRTFTADVAAGPIPCPPANSVIAIQVRKKRVLVTVTRDTLVKQPPGWLRAWTSEIEAQGCLAPGDGLKLAVRITESLPLDPDTAFHLLYSSELDIGPQTRLQVVSPILREGPADDAKILNVETAGNNNLTVTLKPATNLIGYETAWYAVQPRANRIGLTIVPLSAERHIQGETERRPQPATNYFQFPADAACYRLFYKADQTEFTALVVAARTRAELDRRIKTLETGTASCEKLHGELCLAIPKMIGINPFLAVTVNGSEVMLHWGATIRSAIWQTGEPKAEVVPPHLAVYKLYRGRPVLVEFDRASPAILDLVLTGGEVISWK